MELLAAVFRELIQDFTNPLWWLGGCLRGILGLIFFTIPTFKFLSKPLKQIAELDLQMEKARREAKRRGVVGRIEVYDYLEDQLKRGKEQSFWTRMALVPLAVPLVVLAIPIAWWVLSYHFVGIYIEPETLADIIAPTFGIVGGSVGIIWLPFLIPGVRRKIITITKEDLGG